MASENSTHSAENDTMGDRYRVRPLHLISLVALAAVLFAASAVVGSLRNADAASADGVMFGAFAQPRGGESAIQAVQNLESDLGDKLPIVRDFSIWDSNLDNRFNNFVVDGDRRLMISIKPKRSNGTDISWPEIANARPGSRIHNEMVELAQDVKKLDGDVWIAFHHEPEAKDRQKFGESDDFIDAWRKIHTVFEEQGADVEWVWTMTSWSFEVNTSDRRSAGKWYPGDAYVDYLGADPYNWNQCRGDTRQSWTSLERVITPFIEFSKQHPTKQLVLPEFGSDEGSSGGKADWLEDAATFLKQPEISEKFAAVIYFHDVDEESSSCTWWLDSSSSTLNAARAIAADPFFDANSRRTAAPAPAPTTTTTTSAPQAPSTTSVPQAAPASPATPIEFKPGVSSNTEWTGSCTVETRNGSDNVSWSSQGNGYTYNARYNGKWLRSTKGNTSFTNNNKSSGNYVIIARDGNKVAAVRCDRESSSSTVAQPTDAPEAQPAAPAGLSPIAAIGGCRVDRIDGSDIVTWPPQGNGFSYEVSHNGRKIATTSNTWHWNDDVTTGSYVLEAKTSTSIATLSCLRRN